LERSVSQVGDGVIFSNYQILKKATSIAFARLLIAFISGEDVLWTSIYHILQGKNEGCDV
jgi:hypothetical protein